MKTKTILLCLLAALVALPIAAQDLKPVRDKQTKKYLKKEVLRKVFSLS